MSRSGVVVTQWSGMSAIDVDITVTTLRNTAGLASLPSVPGAAGAAGSTRAAPPGSWHPVMEEHFTAIRACTGAAAALADGAVPADGGLPVFRCAVALALAAIASPSQPSHSVNFYELVPPSTAGRSRPAPPLPTGIWRIEWTCPCTPRPRAARRRGRSTWAWACRPTSCRGLGPHPHRGHRPAPGNLVVASLPQPRLVAALGAWPATGTWPSSGPATP